MLDRYNREINYLRISVTDKCNLRCIYCMPEQGVPFKRHNQLLSLEQIETIVKEAVKIGINKVRLTGGEPLVRKNIETLVKKISNIDEIKLLTMTTNATLLSQKVKILKKSGLNSINVSLDTLSPDKYEYLTRGGNIKDALDGIYASIEEKIPLKINMVVMKGCNDNEVPLMMEFCYKYKISLQLINKFSLNKIKSYSYKFDRPPKCEECNRIRLLPDGLLKPCLHSDTEYKVDLNNIKKSLIDTIQSKPAFGNTCDNRQMIQIGG